MRRGPRRAEDEPHDQHVPEREGVALRLDHGAALHHERGAQLWQAVGELDEKYRLVLVLRLVQELPVSEIALVLERVGSIRIHSPRALRLTNASSPSILTEAISCAWAVPSTEMVPVAWLLLTLELAGREQLLNRRVRLALMVIPVLTVILAATNERHGLLWSQVRYLTGGSSSFLLLDHGPWFWLYTIYAYSLILVGAGVLLHARQRARAVQYYGGQPVCERRRALQCHRFGKIQTPDYGWPL